MSFIFLIITSFIIIYFVLNLEISIKDFKYNNKKISEDFRIDIILKLNKKVKFKIISFGRNEIKKIVNNKYSNSMDYRKFLNEKKDVMLVLKRVKKLQIQIEKSKILVFIGNENLITTIFLVPIISTILSIVNLDLQKINYVVNPTFNTNQLKFIIDLTIQMKLRKFIRFFVFLLRTRKKLK